MICNFCGGNASDGAKFCPKCGGKVELISMESVINTTDNILYSETSSKEFAKNSKIWNNFIGMLYLLSILFIAVIPFFMSNSESFRIRRQLNDMHSSFLVCGLMLFMAGLYFTYRFTKLHKRYKEETLTITDNRVFGNIGDSVFNYELTDIVKTTKQSLKNRNFIGVIRLVINFSNNDQIIFKELGTENTEKAYSLLQSKIPASKFSLEKVNKFD